MCEPTTIALTVAAVSAYGGYQQAEAHNQAAEYNAKIADRNAQIADMQATQAGLIGRKEERQLRIGTGLLKGVQRSKIAGSGVLVDRGTPYDILADTTRTGEQDALALRYNTALDVWGLRTQASDFRSRAELSRLSKRNALFQGALSGGSSLVTSQSGLNFFGR